MLAEQVWTDFWAGRSSSAWSILAYCTMAELVRVLGEDRVREMLLGQAGKRPGASRDGLRPGRATGFYVTLLK